MLERSAHLHVKVGALEHIEEAEVGGTAEAVPMIPAPRPQQLNPEPQRTLWQEEGQQTQLQPPGCTSAYGCRKLGSSTGEAKTQSFQPW